MINYLLQGVSASTFNSLEHIVMKKNDTLALSVCALLVLAIFKLSSMEETSLPRYQPGVDVYVSERVSRDPVDAIKLDQGSIEKTLESASLKNSINFLLVVTEEGQEPNLAFWQSKWSSLISRLNSDWKEVAPQNRLVIAVFRKRDDTRYSVMVARAFGSAEQFRLPRLREEKYVLTSEVEPQAQALVEAISADLVEAKARSLETREFLKDAAYVVFFIALSGLGFLVLEGVYFGPRRDLRRRSQWELSRLSRNLDSFRASLNFIGSLLEPLQEARPYLCLGVLDQNRLTLISRFERLAEAHLYLEHIADEVEVVIGKSWPNGDEAIEAFKHAQSRIDQVTVPVIVEGIGAVKDVRATTYLRQLEEKSQELAAELQPVLAGQRYLLPPGEV